MKTTTKRKSQTTTVPAPPAAGRTETTRLSLHCAEAHNVSIAGSFNDWQPSPLQGDGAGGWSIELNLPPGDYEYLFVVDECWRPDPACAEGRPNPFGSENSVLHVPVPVLR
jgi:1,4-alpha-glucan branching enzyme